MGWDYVVEGGGKGLPILTASEMRQMEILQKDREFSYFLFLLSYFFFLIS